MGGRNLELPSKAIPISAELYDEVSEVIRKTGMWIDVDDFAREAVRETLQAKRKRKVLPILT